MYPQQDFTNQLLNLIKTEAKLDIAQVRLLIEAGADLNKKGDWGLTVLHEATSNGLTDLVRLLLSHGADATATCKIDCCTPIHYAAMNGHTEVVNLLIENQSSRSTINARTASGSTPLHIALTEGHIATARLLIMHGADINAEDKDKKTPRQLVADKGYTDLLNSALVASSCATAPYPATVTNQSASEPEITQQSNLLFSCACDTGPGL
jgi:ankyrin repeat protein